MLLLSLLLAIPAASEKVKPPGADELLQLVQTVKNLESLVEEHQERLAIHKAEIDSLRRQVSTLESEIVDLKEAGTSQTPVAETRPLF